MKRTVLKVRDLKLLMPALLGGLLLAISGCAKYDTVTPEIQAGMMSDLQAGRLNLDCGIKCRVLWDTQASSLQGLDMAERWPDLTVQVMKIGYGNDLAYYYLGQAAQGLGYHQSAIAYYNYALALTTGSNALIQCAAGRVPGNDPCQGIDIATAIPPLIDSSRQILEQQAAEKEAANAQAHVIHHHHKKPPATTVAKTGPGWVAPPPPEADAAGASAKPGWVAPPPAPAQ